MAMRLIPIETIYSNALLYGADSAHGCVSEASVDNDSTYIYAEAAAENTNTYTTSTVFRITFADLRSGAVFDHLTIGATLRITAGIGEIKIGYGYGAPPTNAAEAESNLTEYKVYTTTDSEITTSYSRVEFDSQFVPTLPLPEIYLFVKLSIAKKSKKGDTAYIRLTTTDIQLYGGYSMSAVGTSDVTSVSCSKKLAMPGEEVLFIGYPSNDMYTAWFTDEACTHCIGAGNPYYHTVTEYSDLTLYAKGMAYFVCSISTVGAPSGYSLSKNKVMYGETVTFTARPTNDTYFVGWYLDHSRTQLVSAENPYNAIITGDTELWLYSKYYPYYYIALPRPGIKTVSPTSCQMKTGTICTFTATLLENFIGCEWYADAQHTILLHVGTEYTVDDSAITENTYIYPVGVPAVYKCTIVPDNGIALASALDATVSTAVMNESNNKAVITTDSFNYSKTVALQTDLAYVEGKVYGNGKYVLAGRTTSDEGSISYSEDGYIWHEANMPDVARLYAVTYGNGLFLAFSDASTTWDKPDASCALYSFDAINWYSMPHPNTDFYGTQVLDFLGGRFIFYSKSYKFAYSTDGITWSIVRVDFEIEKFTYGKGIYVATSGTTVYSSTDLLNWTKHEEQLPIPAASLTYGNNMFVVGSENNGVAYSTDSFTWTIATTTSYYYIYFWDNKFIALSNGDAYSRDIYGSDDLVNWVYLGNMAGARPAIHRNLFESTLSAKMKENSVFDGWYTDEAYTQCISKKRVCNTILNSDCTMYAKSKPSTYKCTIVIIENTGIASASSYVEIIENSEVHVLNAICETGYALKGWYADSACTVLLDDKTLSTQYLSKDTTIYVQGIKVYLCTAVSGSGVDKAFVTLSPGNAELTARKFRDGDTCIFTAKVTANQLWGGWYADEACTVFVSRDNPYKHTVTKDTVLYASNVISSFSCTAIAGTGITSALVNSKQTITALHSRLAIITSASQVAYSYDASNWTVASAEPAILPDGYSKLRRKIVYGNGVFISPIPNTNFVTYSADAITWEITELPVSANWYAVGYGNNTFIIMARNTNIAVISKDCIHWTQVELPMVADWYGVNYGNGLFIAYMYKGNDLAYSDDGITWSVTSLPKGYTNYPSSIAYGAGIYIILFSNTSRYAHSLDGITWTYGTLPTSAYWVDAMFYNGRFFAIGSGRKFIHSVDGLKWYVQTEAYMPDKSWLSMAYMFGTIVAQSNGTIGYGYNEGDTWLTASLPAVDGNWMQIARKEDYDCTYVANVAPGCKFTGWYADENGTQLVSLQNPYSTHATCDTTLYALSTACITCSAVFDAGIKKVTIAPIQPIAGENCTYEAVLNEGYLFNGWYSDEAHNTLVSKNNPYTFIPTTDTTLYAQSVQKPILDIKSQDTAFISALDDYDTCLVTFTADIPLSYWEARAYLEGITEYGHGKGLLVESGNALQENIIGIVEVLHTELTSGDGKYTIGIFGCSEDEVWSDA